MIWEQIKQWFTTREAEDEDLRRIQTVLNWIFIAILVTEGFIAILGSAGLISGDTNLPNILWGIFGIYLVLGKPQLVNDTQCDPSFMANKLLPDTKTEVAVPAVTGGQVLGVFDVQHAGIRMIIAF